MLVVAFSAFALKSIASNRWCLPLTSIRPACSQPVLGTKRNQRCHFRGFATSSLSPYNQGAAPDVIIPSKISQTATVFWLHGLGDTGFGWSQTANFFQKALPYAKFVFPTAEDNEVTVNGGAVMPSWFDILALKPKVLFDSESLVKSSKRIISMIEAEEQTGVAPERIVLAGFSQGGALALYTSLTSPQNFAGTIGCSTWLDVDNVLPHIPDSKKSSEEAPAVKILLCHGTADTVVAYSYGQHAATALRKQHFDVEFRSFEGMDHGACEDELDDVLQFLLRVIPRK